MSVNINDDPRFSRQEITRAINVFPRQYGFVGELGVFGEPIPLDTDFVSIVRNNSTLALIPMQSRDGDTNKNTPVLDDKVTFQVPHLPLDGAINPSDIQNLATYTPNTNNGMVDPAMVFMAKLNRMLMDLNRKHDITHEYYRSQALNGYIKDADGTTVVDLYTQFNLTRADFAKTIDFSESSTDIQGDMSEVNEEIDDKISDDEAGGNMGGMSYTSYALAGKTLWRNLIANTRVRDAYAYQQGLFNDPTRQTLRKVGFIYGDTMWFQYTAKVGTTPFVPDTKAFVFPAHTMNSFKQYCAPANYNDTVNTMAEVKYAKIVEPANKKGARLETQSNIIALACRPDTLWEITAS